jgi:hypothetical protein
MDMRKNDVLFLSWEPVVLGRERLDERRWMYTVEAPFDMPWNIPDLMGTTVVLAGMRSQIRGVVPHFRSKIDKGEPIALLVCAVLQDEPPAIPLAV